MSLKGRKITMHPNCQILDFSTLFAANSVLQRKRDISPVPSRYNFNIPVSKNFAWELRCLEIIIEAIVLRNKLFIPAEIDISSFPEDTFLLGKKLIDSGVLQTITRDDKPSENILDELSYTIGKSIGAKRFLWDLSKHLMENVPKYSLHPEVMSFSFNMTIYRDLLYQDDIVKYDLADFRDFNQKKPDKFEDAFEYMIKALYYNLIAKRMGVTYCPHPARVPFIEALEMIELMKIDVAKTVFDSISKFRETAYSITNLHPQYIPPLFAYLLKQSKNPYDLVENAINLRETKPSIQFRTKCSNIEEKLEQGVGGVDFTEYIRDVNEMIKLLSKELGIESELAQSSVWIFRVPVRIPNFMFKAYYFGSTYHLNWLKDIAKLSVDIPSMESHLERVFRPEIPK